MPLHLCDNVSTLQERSDFLKENKMQQQTMSKQARVTKALLEGEQLTAKQIAARFGVANPTATISDIRFSGIPVYANTTTNSKGVSVTKYRAGKASREIVAAGYRALSAGLV